MDESSHLMSESSHIPSPPQESHYVVSKLESGVLLSRYLLLPMYAGLSAAMLLYCYVFFGGLVHLFHEVLAGSEGRSAETALQIGILGLLDTIMVANLVVMVTIGGYSIFVQEISGVKNAPRFLRTLTSSTLKVKMSASLVGVSAINLVQIFINSHNTDWNTLSKQLAIHGCFLVAVVVFTWMEAKLHPVAPSAPQH